MKKKILFSALVVVLLSLAALTATNAYFSDKDNSDNTFEFGNVQAIIKEPAWDGYGINIDAVNHTYEETTPADPDNENYGINKNELISGTIIPKDPTVHNVGTEAGYIVAEVTINNRNDLHKIVETIHKNNLQAQSFCTVDSSISPDTTSFNLVDGHTDIFYRKYRLTGGTLSILGDSTAATDGTCLLISRLCDTGAYTSSEQNLTIALNDTDKTYTGTLYTSNTDADDKVYVAYSEDVVSDTIKLTFFFYKIVPSGENTNTLFENVSVPFYFTTEDTQALGTDGYSVSRYQYADDTAGANSYESTALDRTNSEQSIADNPRLAITISAKIIQSEGMPNAETAFALLGY